MGEVGEKIILKKSGVKRLEEGAWLFLDGCAREYWAYDIILELWTSEIPSP